LANTREAKYRLLVLNCLGACFPLDAIWELSISPCYVIRSPDFKAGIMPRLAVGNANSALTFNSLIFGATVRLQFCYSRVRLHGLRDSKLRNGILACS
jgi:hypothetical protein